MANLVEAAARVLVVDDNPANLQTVEAVLAPLGIPVVLARSGQAALHELLQGEFAVVLLDVVMPGMTGLDVARMMRARERTRAVPIIFLTARDAEPREIVEGYLHGAVDYLVKPFEPEMLRAKVAVFVELFRSREAARRLAREEERREHAEHERRRFHRLLTHAPVAVAVIAGPDYVFQFANERFCRVANREIPVGKKLVEIFPELAGSPLVALLDKVYEKAEAFSATEFPFLFDRNRDGTLVQAYFDFNLEPLREEDGTLQLMGSALDVTEHVNARRARDDFLGIASHELKTPLTTLRLQTDMMRSYVDKGQCSAERVGATVDVLRRQVIRLERLVNELLDVSRLMAGKLPLVIEDVDLAAAVREGVDRLGSQLQAAKCEIALSAAKPSIGRWDRMRLDQVITNLLTNAMKYGAGRPIEVCVDGDERVARLTVKDHGIGISSENQARIFEKFERAVSERAVGGLGLGLWIVSRIVADFCGVIRVESAQGAGAAFTVELPRESN